MCGNDYVYENDESLNQTLSILDMRDKCDRIIGLLQCLQLVVDTPDMNLYNGKPVKSMGYIKLGINEKSHKTVRI